MSVDLATGCERDILTARYRLLQRGYHVAGGSLAEVARLATTLNPNPMAAALPR